jgi:hypothetical protein
MSDLGAPRRCRFGASLLFGATGLDDYGKVTTGFADGNQSLLAARGTTIAVWLCALGRCRQYRLHVRRGLLRLYFVVAVPWVAWFGCKLIYASNHYYYDQGQHASKAFRSLLVVPVGGPILYFVIPWVIAGFRRPARDTNEAPEKNISSFKVRASSGAKDTSPTPLTDFYR